jgi:hypothetical protein
MQIFKKLSTQSIHRKKVTLFNAQRLWNNMILKFLSWNCKHFN